MDFPWFYWLMPAWLFNEWQRQWAVENAPCWLKGWPCP